MRAEIGGVFNSFGTGDQSMNGSRAIAMYHSTAYQGTSASIWWQRFIVEMMEDLIVYTILVIG